MSKDHSPGGFSRPSGYTSDLEIGETDPNVIKINTSFGGSQHNAYVMHNNNTHEHFFYNPSQMRSGYHGANYPTSHNHPQISHKSKGGQSMVQNQRNEFLESLKVDKATHEKLNEVSRNAAKMTNNKQGKTTDNGGRERGDDSIAPMSQGRESGLKVGGQEASGGQGHGVSGQSSTGQGTGGQVAGGQGGAAGGQGGGGHGGGGGH